MQKRKKETILKVGKGEKSMNQEKSELSKKENARESALALVSKFVSDELSRGEYAHELTVETYLNLISQAQSGQRLYVEGQMLDLKIGNQHRIPNSNRFLNGYRIGRYAVNYQQDLPTITGNYEEEATITITKDGFLIEEQLEHLDYSSGNIIYSGTFKNITQEGLQVLEVCLKFSALHYDMFLDKNLLADFKKGIMQLDTPLNDLPLLEGKKIK